MNIKNIVLATCAILGMGIIFSACQNKSEPESTHRRSANLIEDDFPQPKPKSVLSQYFNDTLMIQEMDDNFTTHIRSYNEFIGNKEFDTSIYWDDVDTAITGSVFRALVRQRNHPENFTGMVSGLAEIIKHYDAFRMDEKICDSLIRAIIPLIDLKIRSIEKQECAKEPRRHGTALLENANFCRAQIVLLEGAYLYYANSLDYLPSTEKNDKALMKEAARLYAVTTRLEEKGYKDGR